MALISANWSHRWPGGEIPFEVADDVELDDVARQAIRDAIAEWNTRTPFRFVPHLGQPDFAVFTVTTTRCASPVGRQGGRQIIGCRIGAAGFGAGNVIHEIGHTIGLHHEHQRRDRGTFVEVDPLLLPGHAGTPVARGGGCATGDVKSSVPPQDCGSQSRTTDELAPATRCRSTLGDYSLPMRLRARRNFTALESAAHRADFAEEPCEFDSVAAVGCHLVPGSARDERRRATSHVRPLSVSKRWSRQPLVGLRTRNAAHLTTLDPWCPRSPPGRLAGQGVSARRPRHPAIPPGPLELLVPACLTHVRSVPWAVVPDFRLKRKPGKVKCRWRSRQARSSATRDTREKSAALTAGELPAA
jgi:hypothetical protein